MKTKAVFLFKHSHAFISWTFWREKRLHLPWMFPMSGIATGTGKGLSDQQRFVASGTQQRRVGSMPEKRSWPVVKSQMWNKRQLFLTPETSHAAHSTQDEPESLKSRKQDERKIPSCQGHSKQKDFCCQSFHLKSCSAALSFHLLKSLFFLFIIFVF